jgi:ferric-dicitrate binding protein FerR (iron transport regulator)
VIVQAENPRAEADLAAIGSTIYDGDRLQTADGGTLRAQLGGSQMYLRANTTAQVHSLPKGFSAELGAGSVVVSSTQGQTFQVLADGASIRPVGSQETVAQITKVSPKELLLNSTRGELEITMGNEVKTIEPGNSYRLEVSTEEASPDPQGGAPVTSAHVHAFVLYFVIGAVVVGTGVLVWRALESPNGL